jgi:energy-coupling factor transporter ATP-binding protein EcfA2
MTQADRPAAYGIEINGLTYSYPGAPRPALRDISLNVAPGEHVAVIGPNGAGKSSLLLQLNGILEPDSGSVTIGGLSVSPENLPEIRSRVGLVFQDADDQLFMPTLLEDVAFAPLCQGMDRERAEKRARQALESVGLGSVDAGRAAHHLSGGEKRRAALATVLSIEPGILALDEPSAALDGRGRRMIADILRRQRQTILLVTHDVEFAAAICKRLLLLDAGQVIADRPTDELLADADLLAEHGLELAHWLHADSR